MNFIEHLISKATPEQMQHGLDWYSEANAMCKDFADYYDRPLFNVVGILAALSPMTGWNENKRRLVLYFETGYVAHTQVMAKKIVQIEAAKDEKAVALVLAGNGKFQKTVNFFWNILHPDVELGVTIDRHAITIAGGDGKKDVTPKRYTDASLKYTEVAKKLGILPHQAQAVSWVVWRHQNKIDL